MVLVPLCTNPIGTKGCLTLKCPWLTDHLKGTSLYVEEDFELACNLKHDPTN